MCRATWRSVVGSPLRRKGCSDQDPGGRKKPTIREVRRQVLARCRDPILVLGPVELRGGPDTMDLTLSSTKPLGIAVALEDGRFAVYRFSMNGAKRAVSVLMQGAVRLNESPAGGTRDSTLSVCASQAGRLSCPLGIPRKPRTIQPTTLKKASINAMPISMNPVPFPSL